MMGKNQLKQGFASAISNANPDELGGMSPEKRHGLKITVFRDNRKCIYGSEAPYLKARSSFETYVSNMLTGREPRLYQLRDFMGKVLIEKQLHLPVFVRGANGFMP